MPGWLQAFVKVNPVSILSDACRGLMLGEPWYPGPVAWPVVQSLLWAAGIAAVFMPLSLWALRRRV
jgi:oleandomycin transport system permease protein